MFSKIRILLVDDHAVVRQGFRLILNQEPDMEVVGEAGTGLEAVRLTAQLRPSLVILDIAMPQLNGVEAARRIIEAVPEARILILSMHKDAVYVRETLRARAKGGGFLSPEISGTVLEDYQRVSDPFDQLTAREREAMQLLAEGLTAKEIATQLDISVYTVDAHRGRIMKKLGLRGATEIVRFAMSKGLIE